MLKWKERLLFLRVKNKMKMLITGFTNNIKKYIDYFNNYGVKTIFCEREDGVLCEEAYSVDAVICNWLFVHHPIELFNNLKYIQLLSAGTDRVPIDYIKEKEIALYTARNVYSIPMAEFAVSGVLTIIKHINKFYEQQKDCVWRKHRDIGELYNKRVLIVGTGSVGNEVAKRFSAFTDYVYGVDKVIPIQHQYFRDIMDISRLNDELSISDIVILTLPMTSETFHLFNKERFLHMKQDSILVNIARGGLVDEEELIEALNGHLYGAVLDVFEQEPLSPVSSLWKLDNVVLSPHNSFVSDQNSDRLLELCRSNFETYYKKGQKI